MLSCLWDDAYKRTLAANWKACNEVIDRLCQSLVWWQAMYEPNELVNNNTFSNIPVEGRKCFIQRHTQHILFMLIWRQTYIW